jgi:hypothetical protein
MIMTRQSCTEAIGGVLMQEKIPSCIQPQRWGNMELELCVRLLCQAVVSISPWSSFHIKNLVYLPNPNKPSAQVGSEVNHTSEFQYHVEKLTGSG